MFRVGGQYLVKQTFSALRDDFHEGERLVFYFSAHSRYDGYYGYFLYDPLTGARRVFDVDDNEHQETAINTYFQFDGGWVQPERWHAEPPPLGAAVLGIHSEEFAALVPYLRDLVEGKEGIEPWWSWLERNAELARRTLTRAQFLRLKFAPFTEAQVLLEQLGVELKPSPRYGWLG
jgi:hypothetical protein